MKIELTKEQEKTLDEHIENHKMGIWSDTSYVLHFAYFMLSVITGKPENEL